MATASGRNSEEPVDFTGDLENYIRRRSQIAEILDNDSQGESEDLLLNRRAELSDDPYRTLDEGEEISLDREDIELDRDIYDVFNTEGLHDEELGEPNRNREPVDRNTNIDMQQDEDTSFNFGTEEVCTQQRSVNRTEEQTQQTSNSTERLVGTMPVFDDEDDEMEEGETGSTLNLNFRNFMENLGNLKKILTVAGGVVGAIVLLIVVLKVNAMTSKEATSDDVEQVTGIQLQNGEIISRLYSNENLETEDTIYTDYLVVDKMSQNIMGSLVLSFSGTTTKMNIPVVVPVTLDTYNNTVSGTILEISFKIVEIDGESFSTDTKIVKEVE